MYRTLLKLIYLAWYCAIHYLIFTLPSITAVLTNTEATAHVITVTLPYIVLSHLLVGLSRIYMLLVI